MSHDPNEDTQDLSGLDHLLEETHTDSVFAKLRRLVPKYLTVSDVHLRESPVTRANAAIDVYKLGPANVHFCRLAIEVACGAWTEDLQRNLEVYVHMCANGEVKDVEKFYKRIAGVPPKNPPSRKYERPSVSE